MKFGSIRIRLTVWYLVMLGLGLSIFGVGSWYAMRASAFYSIDEELEDRIRGIQKFMQMQIASLSPIEIRDEFREHSVLGPGGDLFQVCDARGEWLYRSAPLENNQVPILRPNQLAAKPRFDNLEVQGVPPASRRAVNRKSIVAPAESTARLPPSAFSRRHWLLPVTRAPGSSMSTAIPPIPKSWRN